MSKLTLTTRQGEVMTIAGVDGVSLVETFRTNCVSEILALCGGCAACGTCHVYVDPEFQPLLPQMSNDEDALLDGSEHRTPHSRLSCQIVFSHELDGLKVTIAPAD